MKCVVRSLAMGIGVLTVVACGARADESPSGSAAAEADSPRQALIAQDAAARAGHVDEDRSYYLAEGEAQDNLAKAFADGDVALARLREAVDKRFGKELAVAVVHAAGTEDVSDVQAADVKVEGDRATVEWKDHAAQPLHMTRAEGKWKVSLNSMFDGASAADLQKLVASMRDLTAELQKLTDLVTHNRFRSGQGVRDRVQDLHDRLFGAPPAKT